MAQPDEKKAREIPFVVQLKRKRSPDFFLRCGSTPQKPFWAFFRCSWTRKKLKNALFAAAEAPFFYQEGFFMMQPDEKKLREIPLVVQLDQSPLNHRLAKHPAKNGL